MNASEQLDQLEHLVRRPGNHESLVLMAHIFHLQSKGPKGTAQHDLFTEVCHSTQEALKDYQGKLADSPAAKVLLEYLMGAFKSYIDSTSNLKYAPSPSERNGFLAKAFGLSAIGRVGITDTEKMVLCSAFSQTLLELTKGHTEKVTPKLVTEAARSAYNAHYKKEYIKDNEASKKNMKTIQRIIKSEGYM
jgi:hypothetical protein